MTIRTVMKNVGHIGWKSNRAVSEYLNSIDNPAVTKIEKLVIYPDHLGFMVAIAVKMTPATGRSSYLTLSPVAAVELVKAIFQNYDGAYLLADKELASIISEKLGDFARGLRKANEPDLVTVTPEQAKDFLNDPSALRGPSTDNVKAIAKDIEGGKREVGSDV